MSDTRLLAFPAHSSVLNMKVVGFPKISVGVFQTTRRHNSDFGILFVSYLPGTITREEFSSIRKLCFIPTWHSTVNRLFGGFTDKNQQYQHELHSRQG
jgi:hypothetical protein